MVSGRRRLVSLAATGALGACCLAAVGCGGGSAAPDPLASQAGATVMAEAIANLEAAPGVTLNSAGVDSGQYVNVYVSVDPGKGCTGSTTVEILGPWSSEWATVTYTTIGQTVYFKPSSLMWEGLAGSNAATIAQKVNGRYVEDQLSDRNLQGLGNCLVDGLRVPAGGVTKGQPIMLNGVRALPLTDARGNVIYVTDTSKPEVIQEDIAPVPGTTDPAGETTFTYGGSLKLTPPPAGQVVSGASIHV
jgi:hypothetical protein